MIEVGNVSFKYKNAQEGALKNVSLSVKDGECVLLCGNSGCGKTTITRLLNGLIPHFYEGEFSGNVTVCGMDVQNEEICHISRKVGSVFQNPRSQFFCLDTTSEIAFGCENLGLSEQEIIRRMEQTVKELEVERLMDRDIFKLSGGEKQSIACASVAAMQPDVFVLDEPTSNLDLASIEKLKRTLMLWKECGKTIVIAEHRLYWLKEICDRVVYMDEGEIKLDIPMREFAGFQENRLQKMGLRSMAQPYGYVSDRIVYQHKPEEIELINYVFSYEKTPVFQIQDLSIPQNEIIAITGQNGAGKSTFVRCFCGLQKKFKGKTVMDGKTYSAKEMLDKCYLVMQDVNHQLFCESVADEIILGADERDGNLEEKEQKLMQQLGISEFKDRHPMSLSGGQKQRVAIASAVLAGKQVLVFDEPTSGLDYRHMLRTAQLFRQLKDMGKSVFIITHDNELIQNCCTCELHIEDHQATVFDVKRSDN